MMADTPTNPTASPAAGDPTVIPQWKKELIQRRKNLAKTIGAVATPVHDSASTVAAAIFASSAASSPVTPHPRTPTGGGGFPVGSPFYAGAGTKAAEGSTCSSPTNTNANGGPLEGNTVPNSEQQQLPLVETAEEVHSSSVSTTVDEELMLGTADGGTDSGQRRLPDGSGDEGVIARDNNIHCSSLSNQPQQQQQQQRTAAAATSPTTGVHFGVHFGASEPTLAPHQRGVGARSGEAVLVPAASSGAASGASAAAANGPQSHSNAGSEHNGSSSSSCSSTVAAAIATRPSSVIADREVLSVSNNGLAKGSSLSISPVGQQQQQQQQQQHQQQVSRDGGVARKMVAATATEEIVVYEKNSVVDVTGVGDGSGVGGGGGGGGVPGFGDAGEELKYGPGIVSRLRCRYLSLALRQCGPKQRPSLNSMRRATSLNNLLDEESEDLSEREQSIGSEGGGHQQHHHSQQHQQHQQHQQQQQHQQHQQKKYHSQNYHYQQQQQQAHREHYANGNGNNHNHNHNHLHQPQQQQPLQATVVLQPPYQKQQPAPFALKQPWIAQQHQEEHQQQVVKTAAPFLRGVQNSYTRASRQVEKKNEYNRYTKHHRGGGGGADAVLLKRARSVEALVRYDHHKAWERDATGPPVAAAPTAVPATVAAAAAAAAAAEVVSYSEVGSNVIILDEIAQATTISSTSTSTATTNLATTGTVVESNGISSSGSPVAASTTGTAVMNGGGGARDLLPQPPPPPPVADSMTIEAKIINGREKGDPKPKRLTSFIDADERPPPDVVKQTMKIFEANANRRGGRPNGGTAPGSEVASKVANYRSIIISGSATATAGATTAAAAEKPPITHPKPPLSPKKPNIKPRTASPKHQVATPTTTPPPAAGKPPPTPKSLEAVNNLKNAAVAAAAAGAASSNGSGTINGQRTSTTSNNKQQAPVESVPLLSTPPSPPARSKHASTLANGAGAGVGTGAQSAGVGAGKPQSNGAAATGVAGPETGGAPETNAMEAKNASKNGGDGRDHHHQQQQQQQHENGLTLTQPQAAAKTVGSDSGHQHTHSSSGAAQGTSSSSSSSSPLPSSPSPGGICESPSIQQLTSKLASLHLATSTPTGAGANGTSLSSSQGPAAAAAAAANGQDRRNLEYVTSDEEEDDDDEDEHDGERNSTSYTVNPESGSEEEEQQQQKDIIVRDVVAGGHEPNGAGGVRQVERSDDDEEDDEEEDDRSVRKISRTAMENIARAGTTTQFRFNGSVKPSSYLPGAAGAGATAAPSTKPPAPPIPKSRESLAAKSAVNGAAASNIEAIGSAGRSPSEVAAGGQPVLGGSAPSSVPMGHSAVSSGGSGAGSSLTRREIEKNQINREKSGEVATPTTSATNSNGISQGISGGAGGAAGVANASGAGASVVGGAASASAISLKPITGNNSSSGGSSNSVDSTTSFVAKWGTGGAAAAAAAGSSPATSSPLAGLVARKKAKPPPNHQQEGTNTMVFNFSDRKDVPDYIENDGVIIRPRPRELPKPGESGFVVLGDLTLETSTDPDDAWPIGPPSPCNGEFANAYIVINGKSSMRNKTSRSNKFKIQFDDSLTSTYEYPSETSLLRETNGFDDTDLGPDGNAELVPTTTTPFTPADNGLLSHTNKLLSSVPLGSAPFASYTPVKAAIDTTFELGVTRTPSPSAASTASSTGSNGSHSSSSNNSHPSPTSASSQNSNDLLQHQEQKLQQQQQQHSVANGHRHQPVERPNNNGLHNNGHSNGSGGGAAEVLLLNGIADAGLNGTGEPESIQYLKPASDEQTVNWSQGTRVTDLLF